jgi:hypothetical protein
MNSTYICFSDKLFMKQNEHELFIRNQLSEAKMEVSQASMILAQMSAEAEAIAPKVEWRRRLAEDDLPVDLDDVIRALKIA